MISLFSCVEILDKDEACKQISEEFGDPTEEVMGYLNELSINWPLSVKAVDNGKTVGFLLMSDYRIEEETEQIKEDKPELLNDLNELKYTAIFAFLVNKAYRGTKLNVDMVKEVKPYMKDYDFIFIPVRHELKTHDYWKRWGALCFYEDKESKFYLIPQNEKVIKVLEKHGINF